MFIQLEFLPYFYQFFCKQDTVHAKTKSSSEASQLSSVPRVASSETNAVAAASSPRTVRAGSTPPPLAIQEESKGHTSPATSAKASPRSSPRGVTSYFKPQLQSPRHSKPAVTPLPLPIHTSHEAQSSPRTPCDEHSRPSQEELRAQLEALQRNVKRLEESLSQVQSSLQKVSSHMIALPLGLRA